MVWGYKNGFRPIERKTYKTENAARQFASDRSFDYGHPVRIVTPDHKRTIAEYRDGVDILNPTIEIGEVDMTDTGTTTTTKKPGTRKPKEVKRDKAKAITVKAVLALSDREIRDVAKEHRPEIDIFDLPAWISKAPFALSYAKFLTGVMKWEPFAYDFNITADDANDFRVKVRKAIGKHHGAEVGNPNGLKVRAKAEPKHAPQPKPAAKKAASKGKPKAAAPARRKRSTRKTAAKK